MTKREYKIEREEVPVGRMVSELALQAILAGVSADPARGDGLQEFIRRRCACRPEHVFFLTLLIAHEISVQNRMSVVECHLGATVSGEAATVLDAPMR